MAAAVAAPLSSSSPIGGSIVLDAAGTFLQKRVFVKAVRETKSRFFRALICSLSIRQGQKPVRIVMLPIMTVQGSFML